MGKYVIKRLLQLIPVVLGITFLSFAMMRLAGGDAVTYMYENAGTAVSQEVIDEARAEYGLDQPFLVQYGKWLKGMLTGNLGESYVSHQDVAASFAARAIDAEDVSWEQGLPLTKPERTLIDLRLDSEDPSLIADAYLDARDIGLDYERLGKLVRETSATPKREKALEPLAELMRAIPKGDR